MSDPRSGTVVLEGFWAIAKALYDPQTSKTILDGLIDWHKQADPNARPRVCSLSCFEVDVQTGSSLFLGF